MFTIENQECHLIVIASRGYDDIRSVARHRYSLGINNCTLVPPHQMPVRPFLATLASSNDGRQWNNEDRRRRGREREKDWVTLSREGPRVTSNLAHIISSDSTPS